MCCLLLQFVNIQMNDEKKGILRQFIQFCMIGCLNALISIAVYSVFVIIDKQLYLLGNFLGYITGICNAYYWNSRFVFKSGKHKGSFLRTFLCYGLSYFLQAGLLYLFVDYWHWNHIISQICVILIITPINFFINKIWAFKDKGNIDRADE